MNAVEFFFANAGYGYDPATESREEARLRAALALAKAESTARDAGYSFSWQEDPDIDSSDFSDDEPYPQWLCTCYRPDGDIATVVGGVDFGPGGQPWGDDYRRVVEAEIALDVLENP